MINISTIHTFKSYMQLFEKMNTINYVISFTGVVRATMDIFSSDASWIVETEGDITEKTDATHSTGSHVFSNRHHFRFKYSFADDAELSVSSNCGCSARSSSTCRQELPLHTNLTLCVRTIDIPFLSTCPCHLSMHFLSTP